MKRITLALATLTLLLGGIEKTRADTLVLTGSYNSSVTINLQLAGSGLNLLNDVNGSGVYSTNGGGSLNGATLTNGSGTTAIPYLYCIESFTNVYVPGTFTADVHTDGTVGIHNAINTFYSATDAGKIAWLMEHIAAYATTADQQAGLQALIWTYSMPGEAATYGATLSSSPTLAAGNTAGMQAAYKLYAALLGNNTAPTSDVLWISPQGGNGYEQDLVAYVPGPGGPPQFPSPEPASFTLLGIGIAGMAGYRWRRRKLASE